jgi:hypothetical protein
MTNQQDYTQHPITPPPELVREWMHKANNNEAILPQVAKFASQWGSDQELEACCSYFEDHLREGLSIELRIARRPKPPSLKEQALAVLDDCSDRLDDAHKNIIRSALEELPND